MSVINKIENAIQEEYAFYCPGCKTHHVFWTSGRVIWTFNGDMNKPTISPSLKVTFHKDEKDNTCHSFIKDGNIQFLNDCTHELAGQTIRLGECKW